MPQETPRSPCYLRPEHQPGASAEARAFLWPVHGTMQVFYLDDPETSLYAQAELRHVGEKAPPITDSSLPDARYFPQRTPSSSSSSSSASSSVSSCSSSSTDFYSTEHDQHHAAKLASAASANEKPRTWHPASAQQEHPRHTPTTSAAGVHEPRSGRALHPLFPPWCSFTKILPSPTTPTSSASVSPRNVIQNKSSDVPDPSSPRPHVAPAPAPLKRSKPMPLPVLPLSSATGSSTATRRPPAPGSREAAEEARRGRNRWPRLLWNSQLDAEALDVLRAYHERAVGGPLPILHPDDSPKAVAAWSRRLESAGL
ncbi:BQ5605_C008g05092 [Microbotryum silenes-dioicae]|uniref:BQ5605_C008g05092 protein n=1 Tax=Microbotryum silenes-dioicae TaxID=796604 RepID=A0A2X0MFH7_9BASI|nr:BQ5605_C008g05092 [Microbotryum silenes-dioicae]